MLGRLAAGAAAPGVTHENRNNAPARKDSVRNGAFTLGMKPERRRRIQQQFTRAPHEPEGRARLRRADFTARGGASTASVSAPWFAEYAHRVRLAARESRLDG